MRAISAAASAARFSKFSGQFRAQMSRRLWRQSSKTLPNSGVKPRSVRAVARLPCKRETIFCFALHLGKLIPRREKIIDQVVMDYSPGRVLPMA